MRPKILFFILFSLCKINAQIKYYNFNFYEGNGYYFTMNQSNDLMLNGIRLMGKTVLQTDLTPKQKRIYANSLGLFTGFIGQALTHEEGHRSVLSELDIGSINKPIIDKNLVAKVTGVKDATLINLRNTDLPNYIRLHTAGLESDYTYLKKSDAFFNYDEEKYNVLYMDYLTRQFSTINYYLTNLYMHKQTSLTIREKGIAEENRDIVGHDLFGMVRHLHRPTMDFYRYTEWIDLTPKEQSYAKRMGFMSLLNLLNPNIFRLGNFNLSKSIKGNFSINYSLSPFGDFTEQNAFLTIKNKYKINPYFRQYFNKSYTFLAGGINLHNYVFNKEKVILNASIDFWQQPKNLNFNTKDAQVGIGLKSEFGMRLSNWDANSKSTYFNLGFSYKTIGFIPETPSLKEDFRIHLGVIYSILN